MEYDSSRKDAGLEATQLPVHVPQFLLLGNQSAGKTTILQRMTRLPLGVTGSQQATNRPFQFTLIHDPAEDGHIIHVDKEEVSRENLLQKLCAKNNELDGMSRFSSSRVSVNIRSKRVTSLIIVDMPGLTLTSQEPGEL